MIIDSRKNKNKKKKKRKWLLLPITLLLLVAAVLLLVLLLLASSTTSISSQIHHHDDDQSTNSLLLLHQHTGAVGSTTTTKDNTTTTRNNNLAVMAAAAVDDEQQQGGQHHMNMIISKTNRIPKIIGGDSTTTSGDNDYYYPALSSLVKVVNKKDGKQQASSSSLEIIGNVQFLLDYVIIGFSKCGTTTLLKWIRRDNDVYTFKREIHEILREEDGKQEDDGGEEGSGPGHLVVRLYQNLLLEEGGGNDEDQKKNATKATAAASSLTTTTDNNNNNRIPTTISISNTNNSNNFFFFKQGFKNPEILQTPIALQHIHTYWPETKLIVSVRNPLKWFRSFYNFRLTIGHLQQIGTNPNELIGHCHNNNNNSRNNNNKNGVSGDDSDEGKRMMLCTHMGAYHVKLFRLGKTLPSSNNNNNNNNNNRQEEEMELLKPYLAPPNYPDDQDVWNYINNGNGDIDDSSSSSIPRMRNKIFLMDLRQLSDTNRTRSTKFRNDLQQFLGLRHNLSKVFRARPFKQLELTLSHSEKQYKIDSICNPKYIPLQKELYTMAKHTSIWLRNYFLKSSDVIVSSPEYLDTLLQTWMDNPCSTIAT